MDLFEYSSFNGKKEDRNKREKMCLNISSKGCEIIWLVPTDLLRGFTQLKAITFSSSLKGLKDVLKEIKEIEILIGTGEIVGVDLETLIETAEKDLPSLIVEGKEIVVYRVPDCHDKIYLLYSPDGKKRVIFGSANISRVAWEGPQDETFAYSDDEDIIRAFEEKYETIKKKAKKIVDSEKIRKNAEKIGISKIKDIVIDEKGKPAKLHLPREELKKLVDLVNTNVLAEIALSLDKKEITHYRYDVINKKKHENLITELHSRKKEIIARQNNPERISKLIEPIRGKERENKLLVLEKEYGFVYKDIDVNTYPLSPVAARETVKAIKQIVERSLEASEDHPKLIGEAVCFAFASPIMHLLRKRALEESVDINSFPVFALLLGTAGAGKTTTLQLIGKLIGRKPLHYKDIPEHGRSKAPFLEHCAMSGDLSPLLIDEVTPRHLTDFHTLGDRLKYLGDSPEVKGTAILTSNLDHFIGARQILRRACFLPFRYPVQTRKGGKGITNALTSVTEDLFVKFLRYANEKMKDIYPNPSDPLRFAREFLLNEGVPVPERYCGDYIEDLRREWRKLYLSSLGIFEETKAPHKMDSKKIVDCFRVKKENVGSLVPLESFDNGGTNKEEYLLLKKEFLEEIGVENTKLPGIGSLIKRVLGK
ncbi:hypothetical protein JCM9492_00120 [Aquifex pyrophilus]